MGHATINMASQELLVFRMGHSRQRELPMDFQHMEDGSIPNDNAVHDTRQPKIG
jgi:hypothetical protein